MMTQVQALAACVLPHSDRLWAWEAGFQVERALLNIVNGQREELVVLQEVIASRLELVL